MLIILLIWFKTAGVSICNVVELDDTENKSINMIKFLMPNGVFRANKYKRCVALKNLNCVTPSLTGRAHTQNDTCTVITSSSAPPRSLHDDVIKRKHFPRYWPFVRGIHRSSVDSLTKVSDAELWCIPFLRLNKRLSKQPKRRWFETPSFSLLRHCNVLTFPLCNNLLPVAITVYLKSNTHTLFMDDIQSVFQLKHTEWPGQFNPNTRNANVMLNHLCPIISRASSSLWIYVFCWKKFDINGNVLLEPTCSSHIKEGYTSIWKYLQKMVRIIYRRYFRLVWYVFQEIKTLTVTVAPFTNID